MYLLEDKIEKCTDQKLIIKTRKKINKLYSLIQHHKKALEELSDSIIIADEWEFIMAGLECNNCGFGIHYHVQIENVQMSYE